MPLPLPTKEELSRLYLDQQMSAHAIAQQYKCSDQKIHYWLKQHDIQKRSISDALYIKHNPNGDPFRFRHPVTSKDSFLFGLGLGLYWGEGNKRNKTCVRLGNTDPRLVKKFIEFLERIYTAKRDKFRFGLQIFSDMNPDEALDFWAKFLHVPKSRFGKVIVTPARSVGTYRTKTQHGVVTVYFSNRKLRDLLCQQIERLG